MPDQGAARPRTRSSSSSARRCVPAAGPAPRCAGASRRPPAFATRFAAPLFVPTGGVGRFGPSEASVMAKLLAARGVSPGRILLEETATDTLSSARAVAGCCARAASPRRCSPRAVCITCRGAWCCCGCSAWRRAPRGRHSSRRARAGRRAATGGCARRRRCRTTPLSRCSSGCTNGGRRSPLLASRLTRASGDPSAWVPACARKTNRHRLFRSRWKCSGRAEASPRSCRPRARSTPAVASSHPSVPAGRSGSTIQR